MSIRSSGTAGVLSETPRSHAHPRPYHSSRIPLRSRLYNKFMFSVDSRTPIASSPSTRSPVSVDSTSPASRSTGIPMRSFPLIPPEQSGRTRELHRDTSDRTVPEESHREAVEAVGSLRPLGDYRYSCVIHLVRFDRPVSRTTSCAPSASGRTGRRIRCSRPFPVYPSRTPINSVDSYVCGVFSFGADVRD